MQYLPFQILNSSSSYFEQRDDIIYGIETSQVHGLLFPLNSRSSQVLTRIYLELVEICFLEGLWFQELIRCLNPMYALMVVVEVAVVGIVGRYLEYRAMNENHVIHFFAVGLKIHTQRYPITFYVSIRMMQQASMLGSYLPSCLNTYV